MSRAVAAAALLAAALAAGGAGAAAPAPQRGGTLILALSPLNPITCLNPFGSCNLPASSNLLTQVLEGAFEMGPDLVWRPNLVSRVTIGRNPFTLTYEIRPQARWSDGVPVTSADFHFTYRAFARYPTFQGGQDYYLKIRRFSRLGPKRFRIELREPVAGWHFFFNIVLPRHALDGENLTGVWRERIDNPKTGRAIGNGPFLVSRLEQGRRLTTVRNPRYWRRHAYLGSIVWTFPRLDPVDRLGPLRRNEIHATPTPPGVPSGLSAAEAREAARLPGWRVETWPTTIKEQLVFRVGAGGHDALKSRLVRQAIAYGIDRVELARRVNAELGRRSQPMDSTTFFPGEPHYRPAWRGYRRDPARARRLLEQAGCRLGGDRVYVCHGQRLRLRFATTVGNLGRELALRLIADQLEDVGIEVQARYFAGPIRSFLERGEFDAALFAWIAAPGGGAVPEASCLDPDPDVNLNWSGYCNRLTMRDVQQVDRILDPGQRARVLNAVDAKLARDVPVLPLFQGVARMALRTSVRGFVPGGNQLNFFETTENWWLARP